jgi:hypothetical protein
MDTELLLSAIRQRAEPRFLVLEADEKIGELNLLVDEELVDCRVIRLRRQQIEHAGYRTVLLASLASVSQLRNALYWAAAVRDALLDPETADIYLFLSIPNLANERGASIEADDQFCRKYVRRRDEQPMEMIDRSFLAPISIATASATVLDPLNAALRKTAITHPWFDAEQQAAWRKSFLSGRMGSDLASELITGIPLEDAL